MTRARRTINAVLNEPWAATAETVEKVWTVVNRLGDSEALRAKLGELPKNTQHTQLRNGVAIISIVGPLIRYSNVMSEISGATSYEALAKEINLAVENPEVKSIVLEFNSGGGTVTSCSELASQLQRQKQHTFSKEIVAYVDGQCCSAAYWLASACSKIYASDTAMIGSIGVQMIASADDNKEGEIKFLSSHSPNKNASVSSKEGKEERQRIVDDLGEVFVGSVAKHRGISKEQVLKNYGQGSVFVAGDALSRGMIDGITTLEGLMDKITTEKTDQKEEMVNAQKKAFEEGKASVDIEAVRKEAVNQQIVRIKSILTVGATVPSYLLECIDNPKASEKDAAFALWKSQQASKPPSPESEQSQASSYLARVAAASSQINVDPPIEEKPKDEKQETQDAIDEIAGFIA
ncbi:MAG: S49 family peptidase [Oligoflexales bacterium]|nr:S49 family peptidase [Oligoflexales bacterium]